VDPEPAGRVVEQHAFGHLGVEDVAAHPWAAGEQFLVDLRLGAALGQGVGHQTASFVIMVVSWGVAVVVAKRRSRVCMRNRPGCSSSRKPASASRCSRSSGVRAAASA
jgi:hypothetical protein